MRSIHGSLAALILPLTLLGPRTAMADDNYIYDKSSWPVSAVKRPLVLAPNMLEIRGDTLTINVSDDSFADPVSIAPDIYFGLNDDVTVGLDHVVGFCVSGECPGTYNDLAVNVMYALVETNHVHLAGLAGLVFPYFQPFGAGPQFGLQGKLNLDTVALYAAGTIYTGFLGREDDEAQYARSKEYLFAPIQLQWQSNPQSAVSIVTGFFGRLAGDMTVPVGVAWLWVLNAHLDLGAEFTFTDITRSGARFDGRVLIGRFALRL